MRSLLNSFLIIISIYNCGFSQCDDVAFECDPVFYQIIENVIFVLDVDNQTYTELIDLNSTSNGNWMSFNGFGLNPNDGLMYANATPSPDDGTTHLVSVDATGCVSSLGTLPISNQSGTGDVDLNDNYYTWQDGILYQFSINDPSMPSAQIPHPSLPGVDMAFNAADGLLYSLSNTMNVTDNILTVVDFNNLSTNVICSFTDLGCSNGFGAQWFDNDGDKLYASCNQSGQIISIDIATCDVVVVLETNESYTLNDGASCVLADDPFVDEICDNGIDDDGDGQVDCDDPDLQTDCCCLPPSQISIIGDISFCEGQTTEITTGENFQLVSWSTGDTTTSIVIEEEGSYSVNAIDSCGNAILLEFEIFELLNTNSQLSFEICEGDSIVVNNEVYTDSGTFLQTLENNEGCDSLLSVQVSLLSKSEGDVSFEICEGDSVIVNGEVFNASGTFTQSLQNSQGCDSLLTINITANSINIVESDVTLCFGETVTINNQIFDESGEYEIQIESNDDDCDTLVNLKLSILEFIDTTFLSEIICFGETFEFQNQVLSDTGIYLIEDQSINGCDSVVVLDLGVLEEDLNEIVLEYCPGDSVEYNGIFYSDNGTFEDVQSNLEGCDSTNVITIREFSDCEDCVFDPNFLARTFEFYKMTKELHVTVRNFNGSVVKNTFPLDSVEQLAMLLAVESEKQYQTRNPNYDIFNDSNVKIAEISVGEKLLKNSKVQRLEKSIREFIESIKTGRSGSIKIK